METKKFKIDGKKLAIGAAKFILGGVASFGVGYIVTRYGKAAILPDDKKIKQIMILVGATVLSGMVGNAAEEYVGKTIDGIVEAVDNVKDMGKVVSESTMEFGKEESTDNG